MAETQRKAQKDQADIQIPRYCYHPDIGIEGSCRMCLVEVEKAPKLMPSCATPVSEGMIVRTGTPRVEQAVREELTPPRQGQERECDQIE